MNEKIEYIINCLDEKYESKLINGIKCYTINNSFVKMTFIKSLNSIVMEYAESLQEAKKNRFEDGDLFPMELEKEELLKRIIEEIEA